MFWLRGSGRWRLALKKVLAPTKGAKRTMALLVAMVVLAVAGVAYVANSHPTHPHAADNGGDHQGIDDSLLVDGLDGLLGGDAEDPEEPN